MTTSMPARLVPSASYGVGAKNRERRTRRIVQRTLHALTGGQHQQRIQQEREQSKRTFHPSTHIEPKLSKLTVPSPSPKTTPLLTRGTFCSWSVTLPSIHTLRLRGRSSGARGVVSVQLGSRQTGACSREPLASKSTVGDSSCS